MQALTQRKPPQGTSRPAPADQIACQVAAGRSLIDPSLTAKVLERVRSGTKVAPELASLTEQELAILGHIAEGLTNRQIGERMFLAEKTVKNYVSSILAKLGLERRTQAAVLASKLLG